MNLSRLRAQLVFYPTLAWGLFLAKVLKVRRWWDRVDDHILLGALPFSKDLPKMSAEGVRAVVNTCEEYAGPVAAYRKFGIEQFRMPTIDFTHPALDDVIRAVEFMDRQIEAGNTVYVHCKAGRARSATVVMCWMIKKFQKPAVEVQKMLNTHRPHINQHLSSRPVVQEFENRFLNAIQS